MYVNKSDTNCSDYLVQSACYHTLVQIVESLCTRYDVMHDTHTPTYWFRKYNLAVYLVSSSLHMGRYPNKPFESVFRSIKRYT